MLQQLNVLIAAKPSEKAVVCQGDGLPLGSSFWAIVFAVLIAFCCFFFPEEAEFPACIPIFWISKWVDYSDKYGLGKHFRLWT